MPDPDFHAFRKELADIALAGRVIASHYAEPVERRLLSSAALYLEPADAGSAIHRLRKGTLFRMLDDTLGWAWGYAGKERRVGYVRSEALAA